MDAVSVLEVSVLALIPAYFAVLVLVDIAHSSASPYTILS